MLLAVLRRVGSRCNAPVRRLSSKTDKAQVDEKKPVSFFLAKEDTLTTRIMGSDWADRRGQPISFSMKLYWSIFGLFIVNGMYAQYTGNDEFALYHQVRQSVKDALFGKAQTNEHVFVSQVESDNSNDTATVASDEAAIAAPVVEPAAAAPLQVDVPTTVGPMAAQKSAAPLFGMLSRTGRPVLTKEQLTLELKALRDQEAKCRQELKGGSLRNLDVVVSEIHQIERSKAELKHRIKALA
ncbi:hypothetical protein DYB25_009118 [Aphanomyces astaci]|uniref:Uncharacterized protein n=1 Tax=Aphanomyces astaci TaxID=112090 RepID=A0A397CW93_APHAT|nr:hypothetical protein DYB36_010119 [Aphanomyces astaci]RHY24373.1 hypothetical protein DYB25_009118 [Aphanomyces astaci]RHY51177.1 hypothetical protein DYB38_007835 [Aphanomyces astaci]RHY56653.1 hypothetical protein DYB34_002829 [Aphanomyces astaci]RHY73421.1 hypothetical protein DYB30_005890 [Aphanomyces astaci]